MTSDTLSSIPNACVDDLKHNVVTFNTILSYKTLTKDVSVDIPIPLPEYSDVDDYFAHIVATQDVDEIFYDELRSTLNEFVLSEQRRFEDEQGDAAIAAFLEGDPVVLRPLSPSAPRVIDPVAHWCAVFDTPSPSSHSPAARLADYFSFLMKHSSAERLMRIAEVERRMAGQMRSLIRVRDWEVEELRKECEKAMQQAADSDAHPHELSRLNERMRSVHSVYSQQIEHLSEKHRQQFRGMIESLYETDEMPAMEWEADEEWSCLSPRQPSASLPSPPPHETQLHESFTIYLGAQQKSMHNARIVCAGGMAELCSHREYVSEEEESCARLEMAMRLYGGDLSGVVVLVDRRTGMHVMERSALARACEQSTELHFDSLAKQLEAVAQATRLANSVRREEAAAAAARMEQSGEDEAPCPSAARPPPRDDGQLAVGDVYLTRHSNLTNVQVVYHLVVEPVLATDEISSRHPSLTGVRNVIRVCARFGVTRVAIPLLLVEQANEHMTVQWCVRRAELVFKCVKGYLMEACGGMGAHPPHFNVDFVLPSGLEGGVRRQIEAMFPGIFHLVPSVSG